MHKHGNIFITQTSEKPQCEVLVVQLKRTDISSSFFFFFCRTISFLSDLAQGDRIKLIILTQHQVFCREIKINLAEPLARASQGYLHEVFTLLVP